MKRESNGANLGMLDIAIAAAQDGSATITEQFRVEILARAPKVRGAGISERNNNTLPV